MDAGPYPSDDFAKTPDDGQRWELLDGRLVASPSPTYPHQSVSARLHYELMKALTESGVAEVLAAPMDVVLSERVVLEPDLLVLRSGRKDLITRRGIEGAPDLVVEILSDSTKRRDLNEKRELYGRFGVPEYWVVDPDAQTVEQYRRDGGEHVPVRLFGSADTLVSGEFPEIVIPLARVFPPRA